MLILLLTFIGEMVKISHCNRPNDTSIVSPFATLEIVPELNAYTAESPIQFSPAISSRNSTSFGLTRPEIEVAVGADVSTDADSFIGQDPAPWQLKAPTTPVTLFKFHILRRL